MYEKIFSPLKIGTLTIRNRIIMSAMGCGTANRDGTSSERQIQYLTERAKGGAGLIITGVTRVNDETGAMDANQISVVSDENIFAIRKLTDSIHKEGAAVFLQLHHPGNQTSTRALGGKSTVGPSGIPCKLSNAPCREMSVEEIGEIVQDFAEGAIRAKKAGADGVELHCAHGYLLNQFFSPYYNRRQDAYGGNTKNRARIVKEIIEAIRVKVGRDFPVIMRISLDEFLDRSVFPHDREGLKMQEGIEICKYLVPFGLDAVNVSAGTYESMNTAWEPASYEEGWKVYLAEAVRKEVNVPVFCVGSIRNPKLVETILEKGKADAVCIARGQLADPEWCNKVRQGRENEIRNCISCLYCMERLTAGGASGEPFGCAINTRAAHEIDYPDQGADGEGRKVIVAGAGPAGMEAARVLAERKFDVTLIDKNESMGGQLLYADKPTFKWKIDWLIRYYESVLPKLGVEIQLGKTADVEWIRNRRPYAVFVCTGALPVTPESIPGIDGENVSLYTDILSGKKVIRNSKVVVVGSGMSGLETAHFLAERGNRVDIVEMAEKIGPGIGFQNLTDIKEQLAPYNVNYYPSHKLSEVKKNEVVLESEKGKLSLWADSVVLAMGVKPEKGLAEELGTEMEHVFVVGDAEKGGRIADAIHSAFEMAYHLEGPEKEGI